MFAAPLSDCQRPYCSPGMARVWHASGEGKWPSDFQKVSLDRFPRMLARVAGMSPRIAWSRSCAQPSFVFSFRSAGVGVVQDCTFACRGQGRHSGVVHTFRCSIWLRTGNGSIRSVVPWILTCRLRHLVTTRSRLCASSTKL